MKPKAIMFFNFLSQRTLMKRKGQVDDLIRARERGKDAFFVLDRLIIKGKPQDAKIKQSGSEGNEENDVLKAAFVSDNEITFKD